MCYYLFNLINLAVICVFKKYRDFSVDCFVIDRCIFNVESVKLKAVCICIACFVFTHFSASVFYTTPVNLLTCLTLPLFNLYECTHKKYLPIKDTFL